MVDSIGNIGAKLFVLQDRKRKLTARLVNLCSGWTAYKRRMKTIRERRSGEDVKEEYSSDGDSDDKSQANQMKLVLELMEKNWSDEEDAVYGSWPD